MDAAEREVMEILVAYLNGYDFVSGYNYSSVKRFAQELIELVFIDDFDAQLACFIAFGTPALPSE